MFSGMHYLPDASLADDTGHSWQRARDWLEPNEAADLVAQGTRYLVQFCRSAPQRGRPERFKREVLRLLLTSKDAERYEDANEIPTVMVAELWSSAREGDCVLFVEQGPRRRHPSELQDDW